MEQLSLCSASPIVEEDILTNSSFFFQVNICFQKVAAEILGIKLSKPELDQQQSVVKADIVQYSNNTETAAKSTPKQAKSSFCLVQ